MTRNTDDRRRAESLGRRTEWLAELLLRLKGFSILARRYRAPGGEIDLIARRGRLIVFAEVKTRQSMEDALFSITPRTRRRIEAAAGSFVSRHSGLAECDMRYDIVAIAGWRLQHLADAWRVGD